MPRLTAKDYLRTHDRLRRLWMHDTRLFAELTPTEQWRLHNFFKPDKDWSDLELLQHREAITAERPSLPHLAGRALEKFWALTADLAVKRSGLPRCHQVTRSGCVRRIGRSRSRRRCVRRSTPRSCHERLSGSSYLRWG